MGSPALVLKSGRAATSRDVPDYQGLEWLDWQPPTECEDWPTSSPVQSGPGAHYDVSLEEARQYAWDRPWIVPSKPVLLFTDQHADADAFVRSLVASGGVAKTGPADGDMELTETGREAVFVIAGDCFDKGPDNLRLLRTIRHLKDLGAEVDILAGNHDVRTYMGLACAGRKDPRHAHLFVRMGKKTIPLFKEVFDGYIAGGDAVDRHTMTDDEVREFLFPPESWYDAFPEVADGLVPPRKIQKELRRIREKSEDVVNKCAEIGISLRDIYTTLEKCRELFVRPEGEFRWFFEDMRLVRREGSFLFAHAGLDDVAAALLAREGADGLNAWFEQLSNNDLFELYHGPCGNMFRTKYRDGIDHAFSVQGVLDARRAGIYAVAHGHKNIRRGQKVVMREGILNFECDCSVDANTRRIEGFEGPGAAVTIFRPDGYVLGISADYEYIKRFDLKRMCNMITAIRG